MSWVLLAVLTLLAALAAIAVAVRTHPSGRAELALTSTLVWNALIVAPIYTLGLANQLTARSLAPLSAVLFAAVLAAAGWRGSLADSARELGAAALSILVLPFEGIAAAARARSVVVIALLLSAYLIVFTSVVSYFAPSWRQWDSLWYHEPIISWTIQNHGFAVVDLPRGLEKANGYPRLAEMSHLWFVIFTDRRLVELFPSLIAPGLLYSTFLLVRRFSRDTVTAMGFACVVLLMPNTCYLLASTYVDVQAALFVVAAIYYATRPELRLGDAWLAAGSIALAVGTKILVLPPAGVTAVIALCRLFAQQRWRRATVGTALGGFAIISAMASFTYLRNWLHFKNPLWPDLQYDNAKYGIHLPHVSYDSDPLNLNMPFGQFIETFTSVPYSVKGLGHKGQIYDYGFAVVFTVIPAGIASLLVVLASVVRDVAGRVARIGTWISPSGWNALFVALPMMASVYTTPALWGGRYHIANVALLAPLIAFATRRGRWPAFTEGLVSAACIMSLVVFYWTQPRWLMTPSELAKLASIPYPEREVTAAATLSPTLDIHAGAAITRELGLAREARATKGTIVAYDDEVHWPALLWNNDYSNRLVYIPSGPDFFDKANAIGAVWAFCRAGDSSCNRFREPHSGWHEIPGGYSVEPGWGSVMERDR